MIGAGALPTNTPPPPPPASLVPEQLLAQRPAHGLLDPSLKTIFDDLVEGVLVLDIAGHRMYSNPALNDLVGGNACHPVGTPDPPSYIPLDQRQRYFLALKGTSSLLTMEGSGAASTWLELMTGTRARVRTRVTISSFTGPRGWRFAVWLLNPEMAQPVAARPRRIARRLRRSIGGTRCLPGLGPVVCRRHSDETRKGRPPALARRAARLVDSEDPLPQPPDGPQPPESHLPQVGGTFSGRVAR